MSAERAAMQVPAPSTAPARATVAEWTQQPHSEAVPSSRPRLLRPTHDALHQHGELLFHATVP